MTHRPANSTPHVGAAAIQNEAANEMKHEIKMVPRRPNQLLSGALEDQDGYDEKID